MSAMYAGLAMAAQLGPYIVSAHIEESAGPTHIHVVFSRPVRNAPMFPSEVSLEVASLDGSPVHVERLNSGRFLPEIRQRDRVSATATFALKADPAKLSGEVTIGCDYGSKTMTLIRLPDRK